MCTVMVWLVSVVVRRYIDILIIIITFPTPLVFFGSSIPISLFIFEMSFRSCVIESVDCHRVSRLYK